MRHRQLAAFLRNPRVAVFSSALYAYLGDHGEVIVRERVRALVDRLDRQRRAAYGDRQNACRRYETLFNEVVKGSELWTDLCRALEPCWAESRCRVRDQLLRFWLFWHTGQPDAHMPAVLGQLLRDIDEFLAQKHDRYLERCISGSRLPLGPLGYELFLQDSALSDDPDGIVLKKPGSRQESKLRCGNELRESVSLGAFSRDGRG